MPKIAQTAILDYTCPKCRSNKADSREVVLVKSRLFGLFPCKDNRYIEVTCMLCGYTEFYNRALYITSQVPAPVPERESVVLPEEKAKVR